MVRPWINDIEWQSRYSAYLLSDQWKALSQEKLRSVNGPNGFPVCEAQIVCKGARATQVHHLSYRNVFHEPLEDLQAVCFACHQALHPNKKLSNHRPSNAQRMVEEVRRRAEQWRRKGLGAPSIMGRHAGEIEGHGRAHTNYEVTSVAEFSTGSMGEVRIHFYRSKDGADRGGVVLGIEIENEESSLAPYAVVTLKGVDLHLCGTVESRAVIVALKDLLDKKHDGTDGIYNRRILFQKSQFKID